MGTLIDNKSVQLTLIPWVAKACQVQFLLLRATFFTYTKLMPVMSLRSVIKITIYILMPRKQLFNQFISK